MIVYTKQPDGQFIKTGNMPADSTVKIQTDEQKPIGPLPLERAIYAIEKTIANKATKLVQKYTLIQEGPKPRVKKPKPIKVKAVKAKRSKPIVAWSGL
jgi:hypothetical protein